MTSGVRWQGKGVPRESIETAEEAARRCGMSVTEWLDNVIAESARNAGVEPSRPADVENSPEEPYARGRAWRRKYTGHDDRDHDDRDRAPDQNLSDVSARLDALSRQLDHLAQASAAKDTRHAHTAPGNDIGPDNDIPLAPTQWQPAARVDRPAVEPTPSHAVMDERGSRGNQSQAPKRQTNPEAVRGPGPGSALTEALAEIEARQRALDGGSATTSAPMNLPRAPTQRLPDLEAQLRQINSRIESMRPCGIESAVETLRDDLAEIGMMVKDVVPRQSVEALESEVRALATRLDDNRHAGADSTTIAGVERGLAEVRDAVRAITPAESLVGFDEAVRGLSEKIDRLPAGTQDPDSIKQLEDAIVALRGVVSHAASDGALAKLSEEVRTLSTRVDQVAASDAFSLLEQRIVSIADTLQSREPNVIDVAGLESVLGSLADKIEQMHAGRDGQAGPPALGHLEDHIVRLVEKLDASGARVDHVESIERGLADLLLHIENQRESAANAGAGQNEELKRDVQRTQDALEAVHGTLGLVVDRLATIETTIRNAQHLPRVSNITESAPPAAPIPQSASFVPGPDHATAPVAAHAMPNVGALSDFELTDAPAQPAANQPAPPRANPSPAAERRPIDPNLPPDHPLEPGARQRAAGSPADRIAASEAALESVRPPVIPDPGGKSNFIAAARRAAQAAIAEAPAPKEKRDAAAKDAGGGSITGRMRKLLVGAGAVLFILGSVHFVATRMWPAASTNEANTQTTRDDAAPASEAAPSSPVTGADRQSHAFPAPGIAPAQNAFGIGVGAQLVVPAPEADATGSIRQPQTAVPPSAQRAPSPQAAVTTGTPPASQPSPARATGTDALPNGIGAGLRAAATKGDPTAEFEIATRYAEGRGVPQDLPEAATWFERAAGKGLAPAQFRLGGLYEKGTGVRKDLSTARRLYLSAAEAGNAKAMHNLAVLHAEGIDGKPDYATAARWFRKAADHGVVDSQYNLAILYARGIGIDANLAEAFKWFALAGREGDREAVRKRDEIAGRLDKQSLASAMTAAQAWQAQPQPDIAIQVRVPTGGWDAVPAPPTPKRIVGPKIEPSTRRPAQ